MSITFFPPDTSDQRILSLASDIQSGRIPPAPRVPVFENMIAEYCGTPGAVAVNSGTAALELILRYLGIGKGDEVIIPAYTRTETAAVIRNVGAKIVMCDVHRGTFHIDCGDIEKRINPHTKAVIVSDYGGVIPEYDQIYGIIYRKKLKFVHKTEAQEKLGRVAVIADATDSFGAIRDGKKAGAHADFTFFSFYAEDNSNIPEGGAFTWTDREGIDNRQLYQCLTQNAHCGKMFNTESGLTQSASEYDILSLSANCGMSELMAAMAIRRLMNADSQIKKRQEIIDAYDKVLLPIGIERQNHFTENSAGNALTYIMRIPDITEKQRDDIIRKMAEAGIVASSDCKPLPMYTAYKDLGHNMAFFPNAYAQYSNAIILPLHTSLTEEEISYIAQSMKEILEGTYLKTAPEELNLIQANVNRRWEIRTVRNVLKDCGSEMSYRYNQFQWSKPPYLSSLDHDAVSKYVYLVIDESDNVIATFNISENPIKYPRYFKPDRNAIYIDRFGVEPSLWRRGVGSRLLAMIEERARKENCECLRCIVDAETNAYYFLKKHGFRILHEQEGKYGMLYFVEKELGE